MKDIKILNWNNKINMKMIILFYINNDERTFMEVKLSRTYM